jgi:ergothioneine biosynthesis protein EgtB
MAELESLLARFREVRARTAALAAHLLDDDQCAQSMPDASPTKWHLAHTSWFFERMVLAVAVPGYAPEPRFDFAFNSYYEAVGPRQPRPSRSLLTRPTLEEVRAYRRQVDGRVLELLPTVGAAQRAEACMRLELGLNHEDQHQELILTDAKHLLGTHPERPAMVKDAKRPPSASAPLGWSAFDGGLVEIGHAGASFAFDNERPRHKVWVEPFELASRPISEDEVLAFISAGGYADPAHWLSEGWDAVRTHEWKAPLYWAMRADGTWERYTARGVEPVDPSAPACHLSFFEADAIARFLGARLPTEAEWEVAAAGAPVGGNFVDGGVFHPTSPPRPGSGPQQLFGDVWEWTASAYAPYPRFRPLEGALGEYNGKFMINQLVLRGGSCFSPQAHLRATYRNFFPPQARWQMSGARLARWS